MSSITKEIEFINEQMQNKNYTILPDTIAEGKVYKIHAFGNLEQDGYEVGYLYLPKGTGIKNHTHITDVERYKLLKGILKVNNDITKINICGINDSHSIDLVSEITIVQTCKINILLLDKNVPLIAEIFDGFICKKQLQKVFMKK